MKYQKIKNTLDLIINTPWDMTTFEEVFGKMGIYHHLTFTGIHQGNFLTFYASLDDTNKAILSRYIEDLYYNIPKIWLWVRRDAEQERKAYIVKPFVRDKEGYIHIQIKGIDPNYPNLIHTVTIRDHEVAAFESGKPIWSVGGQYRIRKHITNNQEPLIQE